MSNKAKLKSCLLHATGELLAAEGLARQAENREKLIRAELLVRCVMLSECPSKKLAAAGHHGG